MDVSVENEDSRCSKSCIKYWKEILLIILGITAITFIGLFLWAFLSPLQNFSLKAKTNAVDQKLVQNFGTCEEFKGETDGYSQKFAWVPGWLSNCARTETEIWLSSKCKKLESCPDIREMPAYKNISMEMKHHARLKWMMKLINLFEEKFPNKFPWVLDGGTLMGVLRHGDIIPHDHDVDIISITEHIDFLKDNFHHFPKGLNLEQRFGGALWKIVDMNSCMPDFDDGDIGTFIDIFNLEKRIDDDWYPKSLEWERDIHPIRKINAAGIEWGLQRNWQKLIVQEFKPGVRVLTYVPMKLDDGLTNLSETHCEKAKKYLFETKKENGQLVRAYS